MSNNDALREALQKILEVPKDTMSDGKALREIVKIAREALAASKPEPQAQVTPYISQEHFDRSFPTSKPEPHPPSRLCMCDDCKPSFEDEPQEQATCKLGAYECSDRCGTPNVCCDHYVEPQEQADEPIKGYLHLRHPFEDENGEDISGEYITLQSHREAMAKAHADLQEKALQYVALFGQLQEAREEIAKKDAALGACVEAMRIAITQNGHDMLMTGEEQRIAIAAITKAKEAMK